jgi:D-alanyl-lipoteichoic acid acyltransferase DltB (MBOAT superfamily)
MAIVLWKLLDDIDTAEDMFHPFDSESSKAFFDFVHKAHNKRWTIFTSDGYDLFNANTGEKVT